MKTQTELRCCACRGRVTFVHPDHAPRPTLFHTTPYCDRFDSIETVDQLLSYFKDCIDLQKKN